MTVRVEIEAVRALYEAGDAAHDFDHVLRVTMLATRIATAEGADVDIVRAAALLHDVLAGASRTEHHFAAADFARSWLLEQGASQDFADAAAHCIRGHRFRAPSAEPLTLEAQVVYDADKLDSMGAIGVLRAAAFAGAHGARLWTVPLSEAGVGESLPAGPNYTPVHEYAFKLSRLYATLHTSTARSLGARRHSVMLAFFAALDEEMKETFGIQEE